MQNSTLSKMAQVLFMAAAGKDAGAHQLPNPGAYFRPILDEGAAMHPGAPMPPAAAHPELPVDARVLSTPSPLLPPPSPIFYGEHDRAVYEELSSFLRRSASPSLSMFPLNAMASSPALAMFSNPAAASSAPRSASPLGVAPSSAFQRPGQ